MFTHESVSSACRFTQRVREPTRTTSVPSTRSTQTRMVRFLALIGRQHTRVNGV